MYIAKKRVELFNIDCMQHMQSMADNAVALTLTDIPYNEVQRPSHGLRRLDNKQQADTLTIPIDDLVDELVRVTGGSIYVWCGMNQFSYLNQRFQYHGLSTRSIVWEKTNPSPQNGQHLYMSGVEHCIFARKKNATFNAHCENTVFRFPTTPRFVATKHPTPKPTFLFRRLIEISSDKNDLVFDPFMGSGTTGVASKLSGRRFIGCEISQDYYNEACALVNSTQEDDEFFT